MNNNDKTNIDSLIADIEKINVMIEDITYFLKITSSPTDNTGIIHIKLTGYRNEHVDPIELDNVVTQVTLNYILNLYKTERKKLLQILKEVLTSGN